MVHHHEGECRVKKLGCCLQGHGHSEGSYDQNMTVSAAAIASELIIMILLQPNLARLTIVDHNPRCLMKIV